jgi:hypothetical protein
VPVVASSPPASLDEMHMPWLQLAPFVQLAFAQHASPTAPHTELSTVG